MKESGIEWIGQIPEDYETIKFKHLIAETNAGEVIEKSFWNVGEELLYTCQRTPMRSDYDSFPDNKRTRKGDILLTRNASPYVFVPEEKAIYSNVVQRVCLKNGCNPEYIAYSVLCGAEALTVNGDTIPSYNMEVWKNISIVNLDIAKQNDIVQFLNDKCSKIDSIIEKQQKIIEKLKEYKLSVITEAVTTGLNPNVEMKDSGIEWIEKIPSEWMEYRVADLYNQTSEEGREELPILTVSINSGISDRELRDDEKDRVFVRSEDRTKYKRVIPGDLAYNMMRAWQGAFGAVRVEGMVSPAYVTCRPKSGVEIDTRYIEYLLRTPIAIEEMHRYSHGIADFRLRLYWPEFKNIRLCLPPIGEQIEIADYIDSKRKVIDQDLEVRKREIDKLVEYKKSIIYEVVTGKKEVAVL